MKKICIVTPEFPPEQWGGLARTVDRVARHAAALGLDVHVAHLVVDRAGHVLLDENRTTSLVGPVKLHRIRVGKEPIIEAERELWDCPHTLTLQMMYQSLEMLHLDEGFDLFHSFFLYPIGYVAGLFARRACVPSVVTVVGNDVKRYIFSPEKVAVCRSGLENADRVVALSKDLLDMGHALTPVAEKSCIIYNSVEIPDATWSRDRKKGDLVRIGCAGIFKYAKGLPYLFKAVGRLAAEHRIVLALRGHLRDSERDMYAHMVSRTGIGEVVDLQEPLPHEEIPHWLRTLDLFVLPSLTEGCPNILMEAMASGVPCIATRTGANEDLVDDRESGLLVPWGNADALCEALEEIIEHPEAARSLGEAARVKMARFSRARERLAWESVYQELVQL